MSDMKTTYPNDGDVWVCTDCYIAHHYGRHEHDGLWYSGDGDEPCELEPLCKLDDVDLSDNTCSDHDGNPDSTYFPIIEIRLMDVPQACTHCGSSDYGNGIQEFSWSSCHGCGSNLGGSRYRLRWTERKQ